MRHSGWQACCVGAAFGVACSAPSGAQEYLVAGFFSDAVHRYDWESGLSTGALETGVGLDGALCVRYGPDGKLYVASEGSNSVQRYDALTGDFIDEFVAPGSGGLDGPTSLAWGADGHLYVASFNSDAVLKFDGTTGDPLGVFVDPGDGGLNGPDNGTTFGPDGVLYVPSYWNNRVLMYDGLTGDFLGTFVASIGRPRVLVFDAGYVYITSETADAVKRYRLRTGEFVDDFVAGGSGGLDTPVGMTFGHDGHLYVTSVPGDSVLRYDGMTGDFIDTFIPSGQGGLDGPTFILARGGNGVDCDRIAGLKLKCRDGVLRATVRTTLREGTTLVLKDGDEACDVTVNGRGKAKGRLPGGTGAHVVHVSECPARRAMIECG
ncbi:MAG: hypothetical protein IT449_16470 [Phycisphaerales bacterium]|nr:hypothetical protein [Phycisphaerales bacterium]